MEEGVGNGRDHIPCVNRPIVCHQITIIKGGGRFPVGMVMTSCVVDVLASYVIISITYMSLLDTQERLRFEHSLHH